MIFKLYDCDFGVTINGVNYDFEHVDGLQIEDPERTRLVRGANAGNKVGLAYKEGIKEAKTITLTVIGISLELHGLLKTVYKKKDRVDCYCISRVDGSSKIGKNAVLAQEPRQLSLDESAESLNIALVFETFDISEVHKS
jgi:hypothetical protein